MHHTYIHNLDENSLFELINSATVTEVIESDRNIFIKCQAANSDETPFTLNLIDVDSVTENSLAKNNFIVKYDEGEIIDCKLQSDSFLLVIEWVNYKLHEYETSVYVFNTDKISITYEKV